MLIKGKQTINCIKEKERGKTMAQLWGGRFTKETDQLVYNFNASISFDQKFYQQDIKGSIAHATMLGEAGIITKEESEVLQNYLLKKCMRLEESGLTDSKCYPLLYSVYRKLVSAEKEKNN
jgi:argininosuccinate lyase